MNHDEYGQMYRLEDNHWWFAARRQLLVSTLKRYLGERPQADIQLLDAGCGTGGTLDRLRPLGNVTGLDLEAIALDFCRQRGWKTLVQASATAMPFGDRTFDAVIALDVLEHIPDHEAAAREIARVLAPGGVVLATVPAYKSLWGRHDIALMHQRRYLAREVMALMRDAGLQIDFITYTFSILFPVAWTIRLAQRLFQPGAPARADVVETHPFLNGILKRFLDFECWLHLHGIRLPFGLTVFVIARRK